MEEKISKRADGGDGPERSKMSKGGRSRRFEGTDCVEMAHDGLQKLRERRLE
jgi:hypothetical protein